MDTVLEKLPLIASDWTRGLSDEDEQNSEETEDEDGDNVFSPSEEEEDEDFKEDDFDEGKSEY